MYSANLSPRHPTVPAIPPLPAQARGLRLLIVENDSAIRALLELLLREEYECTVFSAANGIEALEILEREPIEMVLTDLMMEKMDGLELVRRIRARRAIDPVYILLLTGKSEPEVLAAAQDVGADDWLLKPFDLCQLEQYLATAARRIRRQRARD